MIWVSWTLKNETETEKLPQNEVSSMSVVFRKSNHHLIESERETQLAPRSFRGAKVKTFRLEMIQPSLLPLPPPMRVKPDAQAPLGATWTAAQGQIGRSILGFGEQPQSRGVVTRACRRPTVFRQQNCLNTLTPSRKGLRLVVGADPTSGPPMSSLRCSWRRWWRR